MACVRTEGRSWHSPTSDCRPGPPPPLRGVQGPHISQGHLPWHARERRAARLHNWYPPVRAVHPCPPAVRPLGWGRDDCAGPAPPRALRGEPREPRRRLHLLRAGGPTDPRGALPRVPRQRRRTARWPLAHPARGTPGRRRLRPRGGPGRPARLAPAAQDQLPGRVQPDAAHRAASGGRARGPSALGPAGDSVVGASGDRGDGA